MIWRPTVLSATYAYFPETYTPAALPLVSYVPARVGAAGFEMSMIC